MDFSDLIALKIKELMKEKDMTIYKLETLSGVYSSTIAQFLTRKTKTIRLENLLFLCEALGISLSDFFADKRFISRKYHCFIFFRHWYFHFFVFIFLIIKNFASLNFLLKILSKIICISMYVYFYLLLN